MMQIASLLARILLGLVFTVFGLNGFFHFIPMPPPSGVAGQFLGALAGSNYILPIFALQLVGGVLLLVNRYVPLALVLLGPVLFNILLFHTFMAPEGLPLAIVSVLLWTVTFLRVRQAFAGVFAAPGRA